MKKNISDKIKALIADNNLEGALDLLIQQEENKGRERYNTLILLKGKLEMLEEQELADLLEFDDLSREKRKIAHAVLKMVDDKESPAIDGGKSGSPTNPAAFKYLLFGLLAIAILFFVYKMMSHEPTNTTTDEVVENNHVEGSQNTIDQPKGDKQSDVQNNAGNNSTDQSNAFDNKPPRPATNPVEKVDGPKEEMQPTPPPQPEEEGEVLLSGFPSKGTLGTIKFSFSQVTIRKSTDPNQLELSLQANLTCRTNFDICDRPNFTVKVDGKSFVPAAHSRKNKTIKSGGSATETMTFLLDANAASYQIKAELYGSTFVKVFKIIK